MPGTITVSKLNGFGRGNNAQLSHDQVLLGTDDRCDVRFDAAWDKTVSPQHVALRWRGSEVWAEDQSSDGTFLDGQRISKLQLRSGATLELGKGGPKVKVDFIPAPEPVAPGRTESPAPARPAPAAPIAPPPAKSKLSPKIWIPAALLVLALLFALLWNLLSGGNADAQLADAAKAHEKAVGLVVVAVNTPKGPRSVPMATAWAIGPNVYATNSHVTAEVQKAFEHGAAVFVSINRNPDLRFRVTKAIVHPKYGQPIVNFEGKQPAVPPFDVGLLYVDGVAPDVFPLASASELERLDSGSRIAYIGFPMEGMSGGGVDFRNPVANMQSGIVTSATDYWLSKADFKNRQLIQHNLGATGGSSGSPIFNARGHIVAILSAGNIVGQVNLETGERERAPSAVMINFAQRVDLLRDIYPAYPKD